MQLNTSGAIKCLLEETIIPGVELRPFFTKILAWTTFVHISNPGGKNPCLDAILRDFPYGTSGIRMLQSNESLMKTNQYYETKYRWLGLF